MAESNDKPGERKRWRISPILTSAFALSVLTAMLFLQGRAYREGWLISFGLDSTQFPISTTDTYWWALHAWATTAVGWFKNAWDIYVNSLGSAFLLVALFAFVIYAWEWLKARIKQAAASKENQEDAQPPGNAVQRWLAADGWKAWLARIGIAIVITPISLAVFPFLLFLAGLLLAALIGTAVVPFQNAGKQAAAEFCKRPVAGAARIVLVEGSGDPDWGYRIECNSDVCAVVRDGKVYVVPARNIHRVELPSPGTAVNKSEDAKDQLCPVPGDSPAIPT